MQIGIRRFQEKDAVDFHKAVLESVEHVSEWLPWCTTEYNLNDAKLWVSSAKETWKNGTDYRFIVEDLDTGNILGTVGINQVVQQHKVGNLGYWIRRSALRQGACTKAAKKVVDYAFNELGFQRIEIHVLVENKPSNSVASKLGGNYEGIFRNKLMHNGKSRPAKCYSIIPSDYDI